MVGLAQLVLGLVSESLDALASVQGLSDLLVGFNEPLKLLIQVFILVRQHVAVLVQCFDLSTHIVVSALSRLVLVAEVLLVASSTSQVLFSVAGLGLEVVQVSGEVSVAGKLGFGSAHQVGLLAHLKVKSTAQLGLFVLETSLLVTGAEEVVVGSVVGLTGAAELEFSGVGCLGELGGSLLSLVEIVVNGLNAAVLLGVLALLKAVKVSHAVNFFLVLGTLLLKLGQLVVQVVDVFAQGEAGVALLLDVTSGGENFTLSSGDLLTGGSDVGGQVVVSSVLFVKKETGVIDFFLHALKSNEVGVVASFKVIVLEELLVLQVSVLGLDGVELVSERKVVLVALLDLEDLGLELRNEQVFLVGSEVHAVVVLYNNSKGDS